MVIAPLVFGYLVIFSFSPRLDRERAAKNALTDVADHVPLVEQRTGREDDVSDRLALHVNPTLSYLRSYSLSSISSSSLFRN
jgi:hypothetical protein